MNYFLISYNMIIELPIYSIPEEREEEREDDITTRRDLVFERLNTEYGEDDEEFDYQMIAKELWKYIELALALLVSIIILQFVINNNVELFFALFPLMLLDFNRFFINILQLKRHQEAQETLLRTVSIKQIIGSFGNLSFYCMAIVYNLAKPYPFTISVIPMVVSSIFNFLIKSKQNNQCQLFSAIVRFI